MLSWIVFWFMLPQFVLSSSSNVDYVQQDQNKTTEFSMMVFMKSITRCRSEAVSFQVALFDRNGSYLCAGTIINQFHILAAAHCFFVGNPVRWWRPWYPKLLFLSLVPENCFFRKFWSNVKCKSTTPFGASFHNQIIHYSPWFPDECDL